ncbi:MAG: hypothetical protein ACREDE_01055, partial [Thermoplasmata archaeon]
MSAIPLPELDALATHLANERHDAYSQRALARASEEYLSRRRPSLGHVAISAEGKKYPNLYALIADSGARFETGELRLDPAPSLGTAWRFLLPFERLSFEADGSVLI